MTEDISIVQSGDEQIPIGSKVTISIGTNTRIIISDHNGFLILNSYVLI